MQSYIDISGLFNLTSAVLMLAYWYLYAILLPYKDLSTTLVILVSHKNWRLVNIFGVIGALMGIPGLVGIYLALINQPGWQVTTGFIVALMGTVLMFTALLRDTILWPILAEHDPDMLSFSGPIYTSKTFMPFFIFSCLVYAAGYMIFGQAIANSDLAPSLIGQLLAWGALFFGLGAIFGKWEVLVRSLGITAFCIGLFWIGLVL